MSREDPQFKLRLPAELKARIDQQAEANRRSINAEIIARLEASVLRDTPSEGLISASKAKELATLARRDLSEAIRNEVILDLRVAISKGMGVCYVDLGDYQLENMSETEFSEVVSNLESELIAAGYTIEWDGQETLTVAFDDNGQIGTE
jgi:hypothetical protein